MPMNEYATFTKHPLKEAYCLIWKKPNMSTVSRRIVMTKPFEVGMGIGDAVYQCWVGGLSIS